MRIIIEQACNYSKWKEEKWLNKSLLKKISHSVCDRFATLKSAKSIEISCLLTHNEQMKQLKKDFLKLDMVTNVLSFPDAILSEKQLLELPKNLDYIYLGDIALGYQILQDEAFAQKKMFKDHFTHLFIHSILHLIGFDHQTKKQAEKMEKLEIDILQKFAISSPY